MTTSRTVSLTSVALGAIALLACAVFFALGTAGTAEARPTASASKSCSAPKYPGSGYFTSLVVTRTSCSRGKSVALAHYRCRTRAGGPDGRCSRPPGTGYRCTERRNTIPTEINSRVTCTRGSAKIVFTYQQNT